MVTRQNLRQCTPMSNRIRCWWAANASPELQQYHDEDWGVPVHDDRQLFEMLILEGAQAGLSWATILHRREGYRKAFHNFDVQKVASMGDGELQALLQDPAIIRNRLKIFSARQNAQVFLQIQREFGSFANFLWSYVNNRPIVRRPKSLADIPSTDAIGGQISKDLKKRGMSFVGPTIIYAYMQSVGLVNDHTIDCYRCAELATIDTDHFSKQQF